MKKQKLLFLIPLSLINLSSCNDKITHNIEISLGYNATYQVYEENQLKNCLSITTVAVGFDNEEIITCRFDSIDIYYGAEKINDNWTYFIAIGEVNENGVKSKLELGKDYNMKPYSYINKEIDEQIENLSNLCSKKSIDEVILLTSQDAENAGVTISYSPYIEALKNAYSRKRKATTYQDSLNVGIGIVGTFTNQEANITINSCLVSNNNIIASFTDEITHQASTPIENDNKIEIPSKENQKYIKDGKIISKYDLKEEYGMSNLGLIEWYHQVENFDNIVQDQEISEIKNLDFSNYTGVTIDISNLLNALEESTTYSSLKWIGPQA